MIKLIININKEMKEGKIHGIAEVEIKMKKGINIMIITEKIDLFLDKIYITIFSVKF